MHILTKFLVILAAVLSILLSGLAIALTGNIDAVRSEFQGMRAKAAAAESAAQQVAASAGRDRELYERDLQAKTTEVSQLQQSRDQLLGEVKRLETEVKRLELSEQSYAARIDQFMALTEAQVQLGEARQKELELLRSRELQMARKEIELADRINDQDGELEVARETIRSLQEQIVDLRAAEVAGPAGEGGQVLRAPQGLRARVTDVRPDSDGQMLLSIDAGSSDQLRPKMKLNVVRDRTFLGSVVLETVDLNESIARVVLTRDRDVVIRRGDLVIAAEL